MDLRPAVKTTIYNRPAASASERGHMSFIDAPADSHYICLPESRRADIHSDWFWEIVSDANIPTEIVFIQL